MCQRHVTQIRWALDLIYQIQDEFERAMRDERNDFGTLTSLALLKLSVPAIRFLSRSQKEERDAWGVKVVHPKSSDVRGVPEWQIQQFRTRPGFEENADSAFWPGDGELGSTAEQLEKQIAANSAKKAWTRQAGNRLALILRSAPIGTSVQPGR
jgi:hypothetical protein